MIKRMPAKVPNLTKLILTVRFPKVSRKIEIKIVAIRIRREDIKAVTASNAIFAIFRSDSLLSLTIR
jgi:hypothetical protein